VPAAEEVTVSVAGAIATVTVPVALPATASDVAPVETAKATLPPSALPPAL
jgi:hypothetical protein